MRRAAFLPLSILTTGAVLGLAACDANPDGPASPRRSEIVHLSQAPVDAVPYTPAARPAPAPVAETPAEATPSDGASETLSLNTASPAAAPAPIAAPPPIAPAQAEPTQPQNGGSVPQD